MYYTVKETAEKLKVSVPTVRLWIKKGFLTAKKWNNGKTSRVYIPKDVVDKKLEEF